MAGKTIGIGLLGLGTVGAAVHDLLLRYREDIAAKVGHAVEVRRILVRDPAKHRAQRRADPSLLTTEASEILAAPDIDVVVEVMGGMEPAHRYIRAAVEAGKDVVTANKDVLAEHAREILDAAWRRGVGVFFEASVGGGIPVIQALKDSLLANRLEAIQGILNGTTNYILTRMAEEGLDFATALSRAQELGYAEADPSADVDGLDAARKLAILASIAYGARFHLADVYAEGIRGVGLPDVRQAAELGYVIKLIAAAREEADGAISLRVHPSLGFRRSHPLASVRDSFNAVFVRGDPVGEIMLYGQGAGGGPTASAVVGDVMAAARARATGQRPSAGPWVNPLPRRVKPFVELTFPYYLRLRLADRPGTLAQLGAVFGEHGVNLRSVLQKQHGGDWAEVILVTYPVQEGELRAALATLARMSQVVSGVESVIRMEEVDGA